MGIIVSRFGDNSCTTCYGIGKYPSYIDCYDCYGTGRNYSFIRTFYATKGCIEEIYINYKLKKCIH
jgi:hypothetical protein